MKELFLLIWSALMIGTPLTAQNDLFYTVQIGTFLDAKKKDFESVKELGFVYAEPIGNNLYEVYLGTYLTRDKAEKAVQRLLAKGYNNAFAQERFTGEGRMVVAIQVATLNLDQEIEWEKYLAANSELYVSVEENQIKIFEGIYPDINTAKQRLSEVRTQHVDDAFIKKINNVYLHKVGAFELEGVKRPLIPFALEENPPQAYNTNIPGEYEFNTPQSYENPGRTNINYRPDTRKLNTPTVNPEARLPKIRTRIKRNSVLELQKLLKFENTYPGQLDGYYGDNTERAFEQLEKQNRSLRKYGILAEHLQGDELQSQDLPLQGIIDNLSDNRAAALALESYDNPISKAYRAYLWFYNYGPSGEANILMNAALKETFATNKISGLSPVDPNATYAYNDMYQIILHLLFIHSAPDSPYNVPCWLFLAHPEEAARANNTFANFPGFNYRSNLCDQFSTWEAVKILETIALDLNADKQLNKQRLSLDASARADLFITTEPLADSEQKALEQWNSSLWTGLSSWASRDPLHQDIYVALKAVYYQSYVLLEDFYMDKDLKPDQAKGLALAALHTMVGYHLERFI